MNYKNTSQKTSKEKQSLINDFKSDLVIASPGRINLIGEHTDYNNGFVLPTAINKKIYFHFKKNESYNDCHIYSKSYNTSLNIDLKKIEISNNEWENYILGVLNELQKRTDKLRGFDCIIDSKLPIGAGISSSAALECGLAFGLNELFDLQLSKQTIIELSRDAEHTFVGTKCGIMDQFASVMSKEKNVILLDCESLEYSLIPIDLDPYEILLLNTNVSHSLASSEYNTRRKECESGVQLLQKKYPTISSLRSVTKPILSKFKSKIDPVIYKRCLYIINENERVLNAVEALKTNNLTAFGDLMYASHEGLQNQYEVSCNELDFLVDFSKKTDTILGARMMGGGFGGCTINLIHKEVTQNYINKVSKAYKDTFNIELSAIIVNTSEGTSIQKPS